jgi:hypothetical protein
VLAGTALDAYVGHRERMRWRRVAWAASSDISLIFEDAWLTMARLIGVDAIGDPRAQMFCARGYELAVDLFGHVPGMGAAFERVAVGEPRDLPEAFIRRRVARLCTENEWLDSAMTAVRMILRRHSDGVGRWAGATALLRDEAFMQAVTASTPTIDKLIIVMNLVDEAYAPRRRDVTSELCDAWLSIHRAFREENAVWLRRVAADSVASRAILHDWVAPPGE